MRRVSLQWMLLVPLVATLVVGSVALGLYVRQSVEGDLVAAVDDELDRSVLAQTDRTVTRPRPPAGPGSIVEEVNTPQQVVIEPDGEVRTRVPGSEVLADSDLDSVEPNGDAVTLATSPPLRVRAVSRPDGSILLVALPLDQVDATLTTLGRNLAVGVLVLIVVQSVVAVLVIRSATAALSRLRTRADLVAAGDVEAEIGEPEGPREVAELAEDLAAMLQRLRRTIADREVAAATAERARSDMERFMADASHELRTPFTAIRGYSELYETGTLGDGELGTAMGRIGSESERLVQLVEDLLGLLRPTDPRRITTVDLEAIASAVTHDLRAAHRDHEISLELGGSGGCWVHGDPERLHQAVLNIAANACQHTEPGTRLEIAVSSSGDLGNLTVRDDGPGIAPETAATAFEPFVQADSSRSAQGRSGAGLGLAITRRIAEQHGGLVELRSRLGEGTEVSLRLPLAEPESA